MSEESGTQAPRQEPAIPGIEHLRTGDVRPENTAPKATGQSNTALIGALSRAIARTGGARTKVKGSDSIRAFEEGLLRVAAARFEGSPEIVAAIEIAIRDIWQKPLPPTVAEKQRRVGDLRQAISLLTVHDTPLELAIERARP